MANESSAIVPIVGANRMMDLVPTYNEDLPPGFQRGPALQSRNEEIRRLYRDGIPKDAIARKMGVCRGTVQYVLRGGTTTKARNRAIARAKYGAPCSISR
jgi:DNA-binding NarL/FixJ family response regulator